ALPAKNSGARSATRNSVETPRSVAIDRSPSSPTNETTTPVRPSTTGPASSTPRPSSNDRASRPVSSSARLTTRRALPPSAATHEATFAACPPEASRVSTGVSAPGASGRGARTMTSRRRSPRVQITGLQSWHGPRTAVGKAAVVSPRRPGRGLCRGRGRAAEAPPLAPESAGPRRLRGRALLPRDARARTRVVATSVAILRVVPIYEYRCPNGHLFELFQRIDEPPPEKCEVC